MKIIKVLSEYIEEEIGDAEKYAECALKVKEEFPQVGELFFMLSGEELTHMDRLHNEVKRLIEEHRLQKGEPPKEMMAIYNFLHDKFINEVKGVKILQEMYQS